MAQLFKALLGMFLEKKNIHIPDSSNAPIVSLSKKVPTLID